MVKVRKKIEEAENYLRSLGFNQLRVRDHGNLARIEIEQKDMPLIMGHMDNINRNLNKLGYFYVTLDLKGYRTGSMNEAIS